MSILIDIFAGVGVLSTAFQVFTFLKHKKFMQVVASAQAEARKELDAMHDCIGRLELRGQSDCCEHHK